MITLISATSSMNIQPSRGIKLSTFQSFNCDTQYKPKLTKYSRSNIEANVISYSYDTPKLV